MLTSFIKRKVTEELSDAYCGLKTDESFSTTLIRTAELTGMLPIKKDGSQSAISDFQEYSMVCPMEFARYAGFTEAEVKKLCTENEEIRLEFARAIREVKRDDTIRRSDCSEKRKKISVCIKRVWRENFAGGHFLVRAPCIY